MVSAAWPRPSAPRERATSGKNPSVDMTDMLAALPLFRQLAAAHIERIAPRVRERRLSRSETVFHKGDRPLGLFVVLRGHVKLALVSANGNEKVVELVGANQCFGEVAMLTESAYPYCAQAVRDVALLFVPREVILELLEQAPAFARVMLTDLARRTQALLQDVETYTQHTSAKRVIGYLHQLCQSAQDQGDSIAVTLPTTKQIIASRLNLTPETLSRILHDLSEAKLIAVQGRQIRIASRARLYSYRSEAC